MPVKFSERAFGTSVSADIIQIFKELESGGLKTVNTGVRRTGRHSFEPLYEVQPTFKKYLGDRIPFARMWTPLLIEGTNKKEIVYHTINDNRTNDYEEPNKPLDGSLVNELRDNRYLNAKAGITSLSSRTEGSLGSVKYTTIEFTVFNKIDFDEIYQPYFLKPNATMILDYGWSDKDVKLYDIDKIIALDDLQLSNFKKYIYGEPKVGPEKEIPYMDADGYLKYKTTGEKGDAVVILDPSKSGFINTYRGLVQVEIGRVVDFNAKLAKQGSYECSITMVSENATILDADVSEENGLKFLFTNQFEEILIELLGGLGKGGKDKFSAAQFLQYDALTSDAKQEVREEFFNNLQLKSKIDSEGGVGTLQTTHLKSGIFYQDTSAIFGKRSNQIDAGYISYGLFEDLFLNTLITENLNENDLYAVEFNSKDCYISYNESLISRQKELPANDEGLSLFLYPDSNSIKATAQKLRQGYNSRTQFRDLTKSQTIKTYEDMLAGEHEGYKKPILPIRDLFIQIKLITKAFEIKQTVNDAFEYIIEEINKDSYDVFKLKMIATNESYSAIGLCDINLHKGYDNPTLVFDVLENSIISNVDFNFNSPKGGLASMLAIGESDTLEFYDNKSKDNMGWLNIFGPDKEAFGEDVVTKNLPITKLNPKKSKNLSRRDFKYERASKILKNLKITPTAQNFKDTWVNKVNLLKEKKENLQNVKNESKQNTISRPSSKVLEDKRLKAVTMKDYYGKIAKQFVYGNDEFSAPAVIRGTLSLSIYGNTYLQIGDLLTINYLPKHITDKIVYVITGIEQKLDSNWVTTYQTQPFLKPKSKSKITGTIEEPVFDVSVLETDLDDISDKNSGLGAGMVGGTVVKLTNPLVTCKLIECKYDGDTMKKIKELEQTDKNIRTLGGTYIANEFKSISDKGWWEYFFMAAIQTTIIDMIEKGGGRNKLTRIQLFKEIPDVNSDDFYKTSFMTSQTGFKAKPHIMMNGLVEYADYEGGLFGAEDDPEAALNFLSSIYQSRFKRGTLVGSGWKMVIKKSDLNIIRTVMERIAKRKINQDFYKGYIELATDKTIHIHTQATGDIETNLPEKDWAENGRHKYGMTMLSFAFDMIPWVGSQSGTEEPQYAYLFDFNLPFLGTSNTTKLLLPKWFLESSGYTPDGFVNSITYLTNNMPSDLLDIIFRQGHISDDHLR